MTHQVIRDCEVCRKRCHAVCHETRNGVMAAMGLAIAIEREGPTEELMQKLYEQHRRIGEAIHRCGRK